MTWLWFGIAAALVLGALEWVIRDAVAAGVSKALREYEFPIDLNDLRDLKEAYEMVHRRELERAAEE